MKTVYAGLPIYDSVDKQLYSRTGAIIPFHCTRTKLLPFQINVESDDPGEIASMEMITGSARVNEVTGWTAGGGISAFSTFESSGANITSAIGSFAGGYCSSNSITAKAGQVFILTVNLTLNTGASLDLVYGNGLTVTYSNNRVVHLTNGVNIIPVRCTADTTNGYIRFFDAVGSIDFSATVDMYSEVMDRYFGTIATRIQTTTNNSYDTYTTDGNTPTLEQIVKTTSSGVAYVALNGTVDINAAEGDYFRLVCALQLASGTAPKIVLVDSSGNDASNVVTLQSGLNYVILKSTVTDAACALRIRNGDGETTDYKFILTKEVRKLSGNPVIYSGTGYNYIQYNAATLQHPLTIGNYYLRMSTANGAEYFSERFRVDNIYENILTGWSNVLYETFTTSGTQIISAVNSSGNGHGMSNTFQMKFDETIEVVINLNLNSGDAPVLYLANSDWSKSDANTLVNGLNKITLTATWTGESTLRLYNTSNSNYSTGEIIVNREYSPTITKLSFTNADDIGNILYSVSTSVAEKLTQEFYLDAVLNNPTHETALTGEEKDGEFIAEKIVTKYIRTIVCWVNRAIYNCLVRLPQHDTITITDEVGNTYTPSVGNVTVDPITWDYYDTGKLVIRFTDDNDYITWTH